MEEWVSIQDDEPQIQKGFKRCSVDINIKTDKGNIYRDGFYDAIAEIWYDKHGKAIRGKRGKVIAWQTV